MKWQEAKALTEERNRQRLETAAAMAPAPAPLKAEKVERKPSRSVNLQTDEDVRAAFSNREAAQYLARIDDAAEVERLAAIDTRTGTVAAYEARLAELSE